MRRPDELIVRGPSGEEWHENTPEICDILEQELKKTRVGDIISKKVLFAVKPSASLATCMHMLSEKQVLSAPVYLVEQDEEGEITRAVALVNHLDLLSFISALSLVKQAQLAQTRLQDVIDISDMGKDISVPLKASLFKLMWFLSRGHSRVLLKDNEQACGMCSQADINRHLAWLFTHSSRDMFALGELTAKEASFGKDKFVSVPVTYSVGQVLRVMLEERVGCVAVVDDEGTLLGQFSGRDVRGIGPSNFFRLKSRILSFLTSFSPQSLKPLLVNFEEATVKEVSVLLAEHDVHHLWVVNDTFQPVKVISLNDIMRLSRRGDDIGVNTNASILSPRNQWETISSPQHEHDQGEEEGEQGVEMYDTNYDESGYQEEDETERAGDEFEDGEEQSYLDDEDEVDQHIQADLELNELEAEEQYEAHMRYEEACRAYEEENEYKYRQNNTNSKLNPLAERYSPSRGYKDLGLQHYQPSLAPEQYQDDEYCDEGDLDDYGDEDELAYEAARQLKEEQLDPEYACEQFEEWDENQEAVDAALEEQEYQNARQEYYQEIYNQELEAEQQLLELQELEHYEDQLWRKEMGYEYDAALNDEQETELVHLADRNLMDNMTVLSPREIHEMIWQQPVDKAETEEEPDQEIEDEEQGEDVNFSENMEAMPVMQDPQVQFEVFLLLLKAIAKLAKFGHISLQQKSHLKNLLVNHEPSLLIVASKYLEMQDNDELYRRLLHIAQQWS